MRNAMLTIQHCCNPLHVYCRLVDTGLNRSVCLSICKHYEILIYSWLSWCTAVGVKMCKPGTI